MTASLEMVRDVFGEFCGALARYGVAPAPELHLVEGRSPLPYYEQSTKSIVVGMPDPGAPENRLYWTFVARSLRLESVDAAIRVVEGFWPMLVPHEVTHHLRHHYGAPADNHFIEEQIANEIALAFVREHPRYHSVLGPLREMADHFRQQFAVDSSMQEDYLPGFRLDLGEILVAQDAIRQEELDDIRRVAEVLGESPIKLLRGMGRLTDEGVRKCRALKEATELYFNKRYMADFFEYLSFFSEWFAQALKRTDHASLGTLLRDHILTRAWDATRRHETLGFLTSMLNSGDPSLATAAAETLVAEYPSEAFPVLEGAARNAASSARATALRALYRLSKQDARVRKIAEDQRGSGDVVVQVAAGSILAAHGDRSLIDPLLDAVPEQVALWGDPVLLLERSMPASPQVRVALLRAWTEVAHHPEIAERAKCAMADPDEEVRYAALGCVRRHAVEESLSTLVRVLDDPSERIREGAAQAIADLGPQSIPFLSAWNGSLPSRVEVALLLKTLGEPSASSRLEVIIDEILEHAKRLRSPREGLLRLAVLEARQKLSRLALRCAGAIGNAEAMDLAFRGLSTTDPNAQRFAGTLAAHAVPKEWWGRLEPLMREPEEGDPRDLLTCEEVWIRDLALGVLLPKEGYVLTLPERLTFLRTVGMFRAIPLEDLRTLAEDCTLERYKAGEFIFHEGAEGSSLYVITGGEVSIERKVRLALLGPGMVFGEMALLLGEKRSASARVESDATLLVVPRPSFLRISRCRPQILIEIIRVLGERLRAAAELSGR